MTVNDVYGDVVHVKLSDKTEGYMSLAEVSKKKNKTTGGGGTGGGSTGKDGGDIALSASPMQGFETVNVASTLVTAKFTAGKGKIHADGVEGYYAVYNRGDKVEVLEKGKTRSTVLANGKTGEVETDLLMFEDDAAYKEWEGYAKADAPFHLQYRLYDVPSLQKKNTKVRVLDECGSLLIVKVGSKVGVMLSTDVSTKKVTTGGGGGGGNSGGEWTDPVL